MDEASHEIDQLLVESEAPHPWLENAQQQLHRCYEHALSQLGDIGQMERETMNAFSPNIGALFTATEEVLIKQSGCTEEVAQRVLDLLKKKNHIKSQ